MQSGQMLNGPVPMGIATQIPNMMPNAAAQQLRLQQLRLQQQLNQQALGNMNSLATQLTPQQLLYYQQQQMLAAASGGVGTNAANTAAMQHLIQRRLGMIANGSNQPTYINNAQLSQAMQLQQVPLPQLTLQQAHAQAQAGNQMQSQLQSVALSSPIIQQLLAKKGAALSTQVSASGILPNGMPALQTGMQPGNGVSAVGLDTGMATNEEAMEHKAD
jgi:hypothetical protein